jgi:hypothetical protein
MSPRQLQAHFAAGSKDAAVTALVYPARSNSIGATLVLGHGAGADQRSAFMTVFAKALSGLGVDTVTFNFLYTEQRRKVPDRAPVLEACYRAVIETVLRESESSRRRLFIGGKSMGGRIATQIAAADSHLPVAGLVLLGYPLHPLGRPEERRDRHLAGIRRPMLVVQGSRDSFGTPDELEAVIATLSPGPTLHVVPGGDHSFKVPGGSKAQPAILAGVQRTVAEWIRAQV